MRIFRSEIGAPLTCLTSRGPNILIFRVHRARLFEFCHTNSEIWHLDLKTPDDPDYKRFNDLTMRNLHRIPRITGLYNPRTKVYVEFMGENGNETDVSHFKDYTEEDVIWEVVYADDDGYLISFPLRLLLESGKHPTIPSLVHDDIKNGYYLPTWREYYQHRWNCFWGITTIVPKEDVHRRKKTE
ncbi:hypothetical protein TWF225_003764 [Orbilia oligospora]|nr:hypothetical protein TWF225_003764 [Orbilia oligospora]KAF3195376.1 hypothetical protein TWF225_003764 [Orbilia oligospora]KAF3254232.1 hypothetical protein TWF217_007196 [Orbilia oligospora]KAF3267693.1 hypothetical protein TWF128_009198 [Orbilia oligospora]KAF3267694.1 hypothetical protein TWF128_009198 [Orbilia oligospora]